MNSKPALKQVVCGPPSPFSIFLGYGMRRFAQSFA